MAEELGERTELPTAKRRADARNRAQVARSTDLAAAVELIGAVILLILLGPSAFASAAAILKSLLTARPLDELLSPDFVPATLTDTGLRAVWLLAPIIGLMFVIAVAAHAVQTGWLFTLQPLQPRLDRLSPLNGAKRLLGKRNLVRTVMSILKLAIIASVVFALISDDYRRIASIPLLDLVPGAMVAAAVIRRLLIWVLVLLLLIGLIDYAFQRWQLTRDLRMTKQEVKEERRSVEGDLDAKARRLRFARSLIYQRIGHAVPKADVVVTNPTHFAIAIRYDAETMDAPRVIAKGADEIALRIRELAAAHRVPIIEKPALARALYASVPVGRSITPQFYEAVAEILAYVYRLEGRAA